MADIENNIKVNIDTSEALAQLKLLQQQISAFQQAMRNAGAANAQAAAAMQQNLVNSINATGKFQANIQTIKSSAERFTEALEKNKMSIGEYFRYAGGASKTFGKLFKSEFETINQVAASRVKELQTQYIKLGRDANGALKAIAVRPLALDMDSLSVKTQMAAQRQQLFNQLMKQGSTQLLNFGKNTQWAGRQLMVGFTVPLTMMGAAASKAYMEIEAASIKFKRVYGDMNTTTTETNKMVKSVQALAGEFTKYGLAVADTMDMAASAAAMGKTGADLLAQINQAAKLSVLGGVDQQKALETTISLTNAFGVSAKDLGKNVDFLNAVENQTVLSIEDLTIAIPKAAPVVQQLGGDVKDLAFFLTAMKEGGINASEGANAIKSGLASLINPTDKASKFLAGFGINVKGIVESDKGNLKKTVVDFARALDTLDPLNRARAIEQMFGKFQFSRISTLFKNVIDQGSQAAQVSGLANQTAEELAVLSEREMKKVSDSPMFKFQKAIKDMQAKLAPIGEAFLKAVTPIVEFVSKILDGFNNLGEGSKKFITILVTAVAGIGPLLLMTFGLLSNGIANIMKLFTNIKGVINKSTKPSEILGEQTQYMTTEQLKGAAIAASLDQAHAKLKQTFDSERTAVEQLTKAYRDSVQAQQAYSGIPGVPVGNPNAKPVKKYAGGVHSVPGPSGAGDIVPALLSPGEAVIPAKQASKYRPIISGMIAGNLPGFEFGTAGVGMRQSIVGPLTLKQTEGLARTAQQLEEISKGVMAGPFGNVAPTDYGTQISPTTGHSFPAFGVGGIYQKPDGSKVFVKPQIDLISALAEQRGTVIAREAHGLQAPQQKLGVMIDPTDPYGRRRFIVLESPVDEKFAQIPTTFTKDQYFKQLVASLLRGDKDLGLGNLGGDILADVGPAGVFKTASGKRSLGENINSMEEQAIINLLGVKGGAKRFFAEATAEIAKSMTPAEYDAAMKEEIRRVLPKLDATISGMTDLSPEETTAYANMVKRLGAGLGVDWTKYHQIHSSVTPKKYLKGTRKVPGTDWSELVPPEILNMMPLLKSQTERAHLEEELNKFSPNVAAQVERRTGLRPDKLEDFQILGNLTADIPSWMNQYMRGSSTGIPSPLYLAAWNAIQGKMNSTAEASTDENGQRIPKEFHPVVQQIENEIGQVSAGMSPVIKDSVVANATRNILQRYANQQGPAGVLARALIKRAGIVGDMRFKKQEEMSADEQIRAGLKRGDYFSTGREIRLVGSKIKVGEVRATAKRGTSARTKQEQAIEEYLKSGDLSNPPVSIKGASLPPAMFGERYTGNVTYQETEPRWTAISDFDVFDKFLFAPKHGYKIGKGGFLKLANGIFSVPGPKGAGDVVPAMLSPGEAVIPAKKAERYQPLIQQMVHGNIPGYEQSNIPKPPPGSIPGVQAPQAYVAPESSKSAEFFGGIKNAIVSGAKKVGTAVFDAGEMALGKAVVKLIGDGGKAIVTSKGRGINQIAKEQEAFERKLKLELEANAEYQKLTKELRDSHGTVNSKTMALTKKIEEITRETTQKIKATSGTDTKSGTGGTKTTKPEGAVWKAGGKGGGGRWVDPETGKELVVNSEKKGLFTRTEFTGKVLGAAYGATAAVGAATMVPGFIGQAAQQIMPAVSAATTAMQMIPGPAGLVVAGLAAAATVVMQVIDNMNKARDEAYKTAQALGAGNKALSKFAEFAKTVSANEAMNKKREGSAGQYFNIVPGKKTFGESYMETDAGKELVKTVNNEIKNGGGLKEAENLITTQLSTAISAGVLTAAQARSIATNLGAQLKNNEFGINVSGKMLDLFGPNGENLKKDPLKINIEISKKSAEDFRQTAAGLSEQMAGVFGKGVAQTDKAMGGWAGIVRWSGIGELVAVGFDISNAFAEAAKYGGYLEGSLQNMFEVQQQMVDSLDMAYQKRIAEAVAAGKTTEATKLQTQYLREQQLLMQQNKKQTEDTLAYLKTIDANLLGQAKTAAMDSITKAYEGTGQEAMAEIAKTQLDKMAGTDVQKVLVGSALASKQIGLSQMGVAQSVFGNTQTGMDQFEKLITNAGATEASRSLGLAGNLGVAQRKQFLVDISLADPGKAKLVNDALELAQKTIGVFGGEPLTAKAVLDYSVTHQDKMLEFKANIDELKQEKTITFTVVQKILGKDFGKLFNTKAFQKYFKGYGNNVDKVTFMAELQQLMQMKGDPQMIASFKKWQAEGNSGTITDYMLYQADRTVKNYAQDIGTGAKDDGGGTPTAPNPSFIDPYVQTLREAAKLQQGLTVGWNASLTALRKYTANSIMAFSGQAILLKNAGASDGLIQAFLGGSEEDQNRMFGKFKGGISKAGRDVIAIAKQVEKAKIGMDYILGGTVGQLTKKNELYNAGLEVISFQEKKINEKYDARIKALDEIGKLQDKNNQQEQDTLDIADALSRGDIAAAARAAMKMRQDNQRQALEDSKTAVEDARKKELATVSTKILGETKYRKDLEAEIAKNSERIAVAKKNELDNQVQIGIEAQNTADKVKATLDHYANFSKIKLPTMKVGDINGNNLNVNNVNAANSNSGTPATSGTNTNTTSTGLTSKVSSIIGSGAAAVYGQNVLADIGNAQNVGVAAAQAKKVSTQYVAAKNAFETAGGKMTDAQAKKKFTVNGKLDKTKYNAWKTASTNFEKATAAAEDWKLFTDTGQFITPETIDTQDDNYFYDTKGFDKYFKSKVNKLPQSVRDRINAIKASDDDFISDQNQLNTLKSAIDTAKGNLTGRFAKFKNASLYSILQDYNKTNDSEKSNTAWQKLIDGGADPQGYLDLGVAMAKKFFTLDGYRKDLRKAGYTTEALANATLLSGGSNEIVDTIDDFKNHQMFVGKKAVALNKVGYSNVDINNLTNFANRYYARGGMVYASRGIEVASSKYALGTDTIPAMLTPGEFVMSKAAVDRIGTESLSAMNNGTSAGDCVYNYSITVNATSSDASGIADAVLREIKRIDSQRLRGNVY